MSAPAAPPPPNSDWKHGLKDVDDRIVEINDTAGLREAAKTLATAFQGSETSRPEGILDYVLFGESRKELTGCPLAKEDMTTERFNAFLWLSEFVVFESYQKGTTLAVKNEEGTIVAAMSIHFPESSWKVVRFLKNSWAFVYAFTKLTNKKPTWLDWGSKVVNQKMDWLASFMKAHHSKTISEPHLYIYQIGVLPTEQGHGYGKALLNCANAIADRDGVKLYLETTGSVNVRIYEKFGYEVVQKFTELKPEKVECLPFNVEGGFNLMIRQNSAQTTTNAIVNN